MDSAWLMGIGTGVCNAGVALAGKGAEHSRCRPAVYAMIVFSVAGAGAFAMTWRLSVEWDSGLLWVFGASMGGLFLMAVSAMLAANRHWPPSLVWGAANMGFVVPIVLSALALGESLRPMDAGIVLGVAIMLAGLASGDAGQGTAGGESPASDRRRWGLLVAVFAVNGALMFGFKCFGRILPQAAPASLITALYGCGALSAAVWAGRDLASLRRAEMGYGLGAGVASALSGLAMLGAMTLPAAVAFPVIQGSSLVGGVLACALVFRERLTPRKLAALAVGLGAMTVTAWR